MKLKLIDTKYIAYAFLFLWLYAAANKLFDFQKFKVQIGQSPILTDFSVPIAWMVPGLEIGIAITLIMGTSRLFGFYACFALMLIFTAYIVVIMGLPERIPCQCGGILGKMGWTEHLIFNSCFALLALAGILIETSKRYFIAIESGKA
jgi:hypothetical protein